MDDLRYFAMDLAGSRSARLSSQAAVTPPAMRMSL